jgi:hypothetical protein
MQRLWLGRWQLWRFDVLTVVLPRIQVFGDVTLCQDSPGLLDPQRWRHHSLEMLGATQPTTQCHIPEDVKSQVIFTELLKRFPFYGLLQWGKSCFLHACTAYLRHVGAPSRVIVWHPWNWYSLNYFGLTQDWVTFLGYMPKLWIIFGEILLCSENMFSLASYFRLFQWLLSACYRLVPLAAVLLARPIVWPCTNDVHM